MHQPTNDSKRGRVPPPSRKNLTNTFNAKATAVEQRSHDTKVARMPVSKAQITALKKMLSKPSFTYDPLMIGRINNVYDPKRDQKIMQSIKRIEKALAKHKGVAKSSFAKAHAKGLTRSDFNRSSGISR